MGCESSNFEYLFFGVRSKGGLTSLDYCRIPFLSKESSMLEFFFQHFTMTKIISIRILICFIIRVLRSGLTTVLGTFYVRAQIAVMSYSILHLLFQIIISFVEQILKINKRE